MSRVTNTILYYGNLGPAFLQEVNRYFVDIEGRPEGYEGLVSVDDPRLPPGWYGGHKYLECDLAIGALNHVDLTRFVAYICEVCTKNRCGGVQLIVMDQEETDFHIIETDQEASSETSSKG